MIITLLASSTSQEPSCPCQWPSTLYSDSLLSRKTESYHSQTRKLWLQCFLDAQPILGSALNNLEVRKLLMDSALDRALFNSVLSHTYAYIAVFLLAKHLSIEEDKSWNAHWYVIETAGRIYSSCYQVLLYFPLLKIIQKWTSIDPESGALSWVMFMRFNSSASLKFVLEVTTLCRRRIYKMTWI